MPEDAASAAQWRAAKAHAATIPGRRQPTRGTYTARPHGPTAALERQLVARVRGPGVRACPHLVGSAIRPVLYLSWRPDILLCDLCGDESIALVAQLDIGRTCDGCGSKRTPMTLAFSVTGRAVLVYLVCDACIDRGEL